MVPDPLLAGPIVAVGGYGMSDEGRSLARFLVELSGREMPRALMVGTASGDSEAHALLWYRAMAGISRPAELPLFTRPDSIEELVAESDIVYVGGGNTVNMLAIWRIHGVDRLLLEAHRRGAVLSGVSAGSLCWFESGVTDSFGPSLGPFEGGLGLIPGSNCPHYNGEPRRRPVYHSLVGSGTLPAGYAADDGAALVFEGRALREVVAWREGASAYRVEAVGEGAVREERLEPRQLP